MGRLRERGLFMESQFYHIDRSWYSMRGPKLHVVTSSVVVPSQCSMRLKIRYVITALVLLWLIVAVIYLFPFVFVSREPPSVVSLVLFHNSCTSRASDLPASLNNPDHFPQTCMIYTIWYMDFSHKCHTFQLSFPIYTMYVVIPAQLYNVFCQICTTLNIVH